MLSELEFSTDTATPRWIKDALRFLPLKSQFILAGNIRDRYQFPVETPGPGEEDCPDGRPNTSLWD